MSFEDDMEIAMATTRAREAREYCREDIFEAQRTTQALRGNMTRAKKAANELASFLNGCKSEIREEDWKVIQDKLSTIRREL